jgi:parallel beta-helix repeat protein
VLKDNITATAAELKPTWNGADGCIVIAADFVTVDLSGHLIIGLGLVSNSVGIAQDRTTRFGEVVENGSITGFGYGVAFVGSGHTIQGVNAINNFQNGFYLVGSAHTIKDSNASNNGNDGVDLDGNSSTIKDVNASNNRRVGIFLRKQNRDPLTNEAGNRVIGNTANNNGVAGIWVETCPNLLLENMAHFNNHNSASDNINDPAGCGVRQENYPAP